MRTGWQRRQLILKSQSLAVSLVVLASPAWAAKAVKIPDLSGTWQLNEDLTLRLQQEAQKPDQGQRGPEGGGRGGRGGGRGGGMGRRGGGAPAGEPRPTEGTPGAADNEPGPGSEGKEGVLTITWAAPQLTLAYPGDRRRVLYTDDRKVTEDRPDGKKVKIRARWKDDNLEVVTQTPDGTTRTEIYEISNDGKRLFIIVGLEGHGPRTREFRRVYDRVEASKDGTAPAPTPP